MAETNLLLKPRTLNGEGGELVAVTPHSAGWQYLSFSARRLPAGGAYEAETGNQELALVALAGTAAVESSEGGWPRVGERPDVFSGMPYLLYLPPGTRYRVQAQTAFDFALGMAPADVCYPARLITPDEVEVEIRGGGQATRQINNMFIRPDVPAQRLLVVEVYTPGGNWSSYPPHKHDEHRPPAEHVLEEVYYYRIDRPDGFAFQHVYTADHRIDETLTVHDGDLVLIPAGYHPVAAPPGYNVYYLNVLAGDIRAMIGADDPAHTWVKETWQERDPRVPLVRKQ